MKITFTEGSYVPKEDELLESFQEELILDSKCFTIEIDGTALGSFAFCENVFDVQGFTVLTQFALAPEAIRHFQRIFETILTQYEIKSAMVATNYEFFLATAMDFHKSVTMQAYLFTTSNAPVRPPEFPRSHFTPASPEDLQEILRLTNNHFDFLLHPRKKETHQLYVLKDGEETLGFGLLETGLILKNASSLGIYTMEKHRRKGAGRSMMMHLKDICRENGIKPITGCNWYNKKSKATLESAGFISETRLLRVEFTTEEKWLSL
ncbi:GNAT family N-acetyltransferase [Mesobacillus subterraneus]|uniref:N-acetyltransferase n=1 Tax=Mesobacillus subterraneus TaxID=285983 RepID=A0A3R9FHW3_9BACI|nr:GNAT family N-acetyltransferase [Mesobacillus subterraneus]RSD28385.1 N-acetyltransferase [Mesobacillus subterraneus]